ncbi:MAG: hypothetical protein JOY90_28735, partial [Bradyrhizobium sp.]|nr:hypothetical protein [Bradyrhizobium sp.]
MLIGALILTISVTALLFPQRASALPSYARQTGLGCGVCHTEFPQLTPFGRRFKIGGYTLGIQDPAAAEKKKFPLFPTKAQASPEQLLTGEPKST